METKFECRYTQDWEYNKTLYSHTRKQNKGLLLWWGVWTLFLLAMALFQFISYSMKAFGWLYLFIALFSFWKGFGGPIRVRRRWKKTCKQRGKDSIETVFQFGDSVRLSDDSGVAIEFTWDIFEKSYKLKEMGPYLKFEDMQRKKNNLYLPRSGFADGNGNAFLVWVRDMHPALVHK